MVSFYFWSLLQGGSGGGESGVWHELRAVSGEGSVRSWTEVSCVGNPGGSCWGPLLWAVSWR